MTISQNSGITILLLITLAFSRTTMWAFAYSSYVGYSGAPTSNGTCTRSCHAQASFQPTCEVVGFPVTYIPGQQYLISVRHSGPRTINQFNCSIRRDADSAVVGTILPATNTAIYSHSREIIGVHLSSANQDSASFIWQAPDSGVGNITLYWAGLQGSRSYGADQQITLSATPSQAEVEYLPQIPATFEIGQNYPNPFNEITIIPFSLTEQGDVVVEIANVLGQTVFELVLADAKPGTYRLAWNARDQQQRPLPSGVYFYQLRTSQGRLTRKMALLR